MRIWTFATARLIESKYRPRKRKDGTTRAVDANAPRASPATVNRDLRVLRTTIRTAARWEYIHTAPSIKFLKKPEKLATYVTPEHFAAIYKACTAVRSTADQPYAAADWWRALLMIAYMSGWRIGSLLALRRENVDMVAATTLSLAKYNKGKRDVKIQLHPIVLKHLQKLASFSLVIFPWAHDRRTLWKEFHAIQKSAGVKPEGGKKWYDFHDLRRAFATMNAANMTADAMQALMQHKDYQTTQRYINMARQLNPAVATLYLPTVAVGG